LLASWQFAHFAIEASHDEQVNVSVA